MMFRKPACLLAFAASALLLGGCQEIDQQAKSNRIYAASKDSHAWQGEKFGNDRQKWETALAERNNRQNESVRIEHR